MRASRMAGSLKALMPAADARRQITAGRLKLKAALAHRYQED